MSFAAAIVTKLSRESARTLRGRGGKVNFRHAKSTSDIARWRRLLTLLEQLVRCKWTFQLECPSPVKLTRRRRPILFSPEIASFREAAFPAAVAANKPPPPKKIPPR